MLLKRVCATTLVVMQLCRDAIVVCAGCVFFGDQVGGLQLLGFLGMMGGGFCYCAVGRNAGSWCGVFMLGLVVVPILFRSAWNLYCDLRSGDGRLRSFYFNGVFVGWATSNSVMWHTFNEDDEM
jgi:hypothetical protein